MYTMNPSARANALTKLFLAAVLAAPGAAGAFGTDERVDVSVRSVTGNDLTGHVESLSIAAGLVLQGGEQERVVLEPGDLIQIDVLQARDSIATSQALVELSQGDQIRGKLVDGTPESVVMETSQLGRINVPIDHIKRIRTAPSFQPAYRRAADWFERSPMQGEDAVLLTNGDVVRGFIVELNQRGLVLEGESGNLPIEHRLILAARFAQPSRATRAGPALIVTTTDANRLTMVDFDWQSGEVHGRPWFGPVIDIPVRAIRRIEAVGGRWRRLPDIEPISHQQLPMFGLDWPYAVDRNVLGQPLRVSGQRFDHGIGVHARSILIYDLKGRYQSFVTLMGLDDSSGPLADVTIAIVVDEQRRYEKANVKRGHLIGPIRIDVSRARSLKLICDFGENGDVQDRFNWIEPGLVR